MDEKDQKKGKSFFSGLEWLSWVAWWKLDPTELAEQADKYNSLGFFKSFRGISCLLIVLSIVITSVFSFLGWTPADYLYDLVLYIPLLFLMYRGWKWSFIAAMVLWTLEKGISLFDMQMNHPSGAPALIINLFWWAFYMKFFYGAFVVENTRKRFDPSINSPKPETEQKGNIFSKLSVTGKPLALIIITIVILACWFYWFQYRPAQIKHDCSQTTVNTAYQKGWTVEQAKAHYEFCLHDKGL